MQLVQLSPYYLCIGGLISVFLGGGLTAVNILSIHTASCPADLSWPHPQNNQLVCEEGCNISLRNLDIYVQCNEMSQSRKTRSDYFVNCSEVQEIKSKLFFSPS
jgi:hypothetical protein